MKSKRVVHTGRFSFDVNPLNFYEITLFTKLTEPQESSAMSRCEGFCGNSRILLKTSKGLSFMSLEVLTQVQKNRS
ncbi:hypothetical protein LEP1GSC008_4213 [Leptospira kirschneri serovar Bulgarica str. Nikolaevo]|uniref:Uncharacterized protein n=1 Tax=Leptospira kirschneri serovar Bulgarica str. Nikolaevo TaxID=1240687 RepID=M6F7H4_9LEPT|nr:hypothetical protein LEP1GSC008_4213 [Leptospira kirschneri serovar Bulgarica str. Nikolaevo]